MKKIRFIYNPVSGQGIIKNKIDFIIENFQKQGFQVIPYKLLGKNDIKCAFDSFDPDEYYVIVASGGDGTIHEVVNEIKLRELDLPLGIIPTGTSNDFANFLGIPKNIDECIDIITKKQNIEDIDIGKINDKYFINVVAGGLLSGIAHKAKKNLKNSLGMFAYYLKAIEEIKNVKPFKVNIKTEKLNISEDVLLFLVLNTSIAGGFKVIPSATINDGMLDVCLIKNCSVSDFGALFIKLLKGEHINDDKFIYFQAKNIYIDCHNKVETDIDGEKGKDFPLNIEVNNKCLKVFK